jgi:hypothetical protein
VPVLEPAAAHDEVSSKVHYTGTWTRSARTGDWLGHEKSATKTGAAASITFRGKRVWWIATEGTEFGRARVSIDGNVVATVDLRAPSDAARGPPSCTRSPRSERTRSRITALGTAGRPRVDVDVFAVSQR